MVAVISLILIITLSLLVTKIATVILVQTGLSEEAARFQARSAFTSTGFTTKESEAIVQHPNRRRVVLTLMLLGNAGIVTVIASLLLTFVNHDEKLIPWYYNIAILAGGISIIWVLSSLKSFDRFLIRIIEKVLHRYTTLLKRDFRALLKLGKDFQVSEFYVEAGDWFEGQALEHCRLENEQIIILGIEHPNGEFQGLIDKEVTIKEGDKLILYGKGEAMKKLDGKKKKDNQDSAVKK